MKGDLLLTKILLDQFLWQQRVASYDRRSHRHRRPPLSSHIFRTNFQNVQWRVSSNLRIICCCVKTTRDLDRERNFIGIFCDCFIRRTVWKNVELLFTGFKLYWERLKVKG
jgi:hypothetical protein